MKKSYVFAISVALFALGLSLNLRPETPLLYEGVGEETDSLEKIRADFSNLIQHRTEGQDPCGAYQWWERLEMLVYRYNRFTDTPDDSAISQIGKDVPGLMDRMEAAGIAAAKLLGQEKERPSCVTKEQADQLMDRYLSLAVP